MIRNTAPIELGLEETIMEVVRSDTPLLSIAAKFSLNNYQIFLPTEIIEFRGARFQQAKDLVADLVYDKRRSKRHQSRNVIPSINNPPIIALDGIAEGRDYLGLNQELLKTAFHLGVQEYSLLDARMNRYNPSFKLLLFPEETTGISEKKDMLKRYSESRYDSKKYEHVKTILFTTGDKNYLAVIHGERQLSFASVAAVDGVAGKVELVSDGSEQQITGRPRGTLSPLIHADYFKNLNGVFISEELLSQRIAVPYYEVVLDRRSSLIVSSMQDIFNVLTKIPGYPSTSIFLNK